MDKRSDPSIISVPIAEGISAPSPWHGVKRDSLWQLTERATRAALGAGISILIARSIGPSNFGLYNYSLSIVALFSFLGQAGLDALLLRELIRAPENAGRVLGASILMRLAGALLAFVGATSLAFLTELPDLNDAPMIVGLLSLGGLLQSTWAVEVWLQASGRMRYAARARIFTYCIAAILRLATLATPHPVPLLAAVAVIESALCALLLWRAARSKATGAPVRLEMPPPALLGKLSRLAAPMLLSGLTIAVYSRIDVFMLGQMLGSSEAGLYGAATLLSEGLYLFPVAIATATAPRLSSLFVENQSAYLASLYRLLKALSIFGLCAAIATSIAAGPMIRLFFGPTYEGSEQALRIHVWSTWMVFISTASDSWYINNDLRRLYLAKTLAAAAINVALNATLIPIWHIQGAAFATVAAYTISAIGFGFLSRRTRPLARMQVRAMLGLPERSYKSGIPT